MKENVQYIVVVNKVFKNYAYVKVSYYNKLHKPVTKWWFLHKRGLALYLSYLDNNFVYIEDLKNHITEGQRIPVLLVLRRTGKELTSENRYIFKADTSKVEELFVLRYIEQKNKYLKEKKIKEEQEREAFINWIDI